MIPSVTNKSAYYARTSSDEQREKQTIQSQIAALEAEIQKNGETVVSRYNDDGFSGAMLDRPALVSYGRTRNERSSRSFIFIRRTA